MSYQKYMYIYIYIIALHAIIYLHTFASPYDRVGA